MQKLILQIYILWEIKPGIPPLNKMLLFLRYDLKQHKPQNDTLDRNEVLGDGHCHLQTILVLFRLLDINDNKLNTINEDNEKQLSTAKSKVFTGRKFLKNVEKP